MDIATGVNATGVREIIGFAVGDNETEAFWKEFLRSLRARGLSGVQLVISDAHAGLVAAITQVFLGSAWQRCRVHFVRDVLARIEAGSGEMVAATIRTIFAQPDAAAVHTQLHLVADLLAAQFLVVKDMLLAAETDITAYATFPDTRWKKIWSTNPLERLNREVKRRADVVQVFLSPGRTRTPHRRRPGRTPRRMASRRPPLPLRRLHGRTPRHGHHHPVHRTSRTPTQQEDRLTRALTPHKWP